MSVVKQTNPSSNPLQDSAGDFTLQAVGYLVTTNKNVGGQTMPL